MHKLIDSRLLKEKQSLGVVVNHQNIVLVRDTNKAYAYLNNCPHLNITLEFQDNVFLDQSLEYIQCSNHGALFEIKTGACIWGPCSGQSLQPIKIKEFDGAIWLTETK